LFLGQFFASKSLANLFTAEHAEFAENPLFFFAAFACFAVNAFGLSVRR